MRLINTSTLEFREFFDSKIPKYYAILSHRWGSDEATFQDFEKGVQEKREGFKEIKDFCDFVSGYDVEWGWVDTCCIDKRSSAELTEAINSMYAWYRNAHHCYAHLSDVWSEDDVRVNELSQTTLDQIKKSQWFTRGWTLQELLAPRVVYFIDHDWKYLGTKEDLVQDISEVTGIDTMYLLPDPDDILDDEEYGPCTKTSDCRGHPPSLRLALTGRWEPSLATRMSWVANRQTTRIEDMAYCMLGIFDVNMPLLYGEGRKAFRRLQHEIIKQSSDDSIFAWTADQQVTGMLAHWPTNFANSRNVLENAPHKTHRGPYAITNQGLELPITWRCWDPREVGKIQEIKILLDCGMCGPQGVKNIMLRLVSVDGTNWLRWSRYQIVPMDDGPWYRPQLSSQANVMQHLEASRPTKSIFGTKQGNPRIPTGPLANLTKLMVRADWLYDPDPPGKIYDPLSRKT
ncbi:MAG: hypothetical protein L6R42_004048 [Xanthoria sp. 1 TBL-2021]|nr:MAG: hypothetical protein L6R42_004048 [Xanthoria sp. 1 TBL-2021]